MTPRPTTRLHGREKPALTRLGVAAWLLAYAALAVSAFILTGGFRG